MACSAFVTRLMTTCCSSWPSPRTAGAAPSISERISTLSARSTRCRISDLNGVLGVRDEIDDDLLQLLAEPEDGRRGAVHLRADFHALRPQHTVPDLRSEWRARRS